MSYTDQDVERVAEAFYDAMPDDPFEKPMSSDGFERPWAYSWEYASKHYPERRGVKRAYEAARAALEAMAREPISFEGDWKKRFANDAEPAIQYDVTQEVIDELLFNLGSNRNSLPYYGILKVCNVVAQVARAQALGIDPDIFRMTDEEAAAVMLERAQAFAEAGKPVIVVEDRAQEGDDA